MTLEMAFQLRLATPSTLSKMGQRFHDKEETNRFDFCSVHTRKAFPDGLGTRSKREVV